MREKDSFAGFFWRTMAVLALLGGIGLLGAAGAQADVKPIELVDSNKCFTCHARIKEFHLRGSHAGLNCAYCHTETDKHVGNPMQFAPITSFDQRTCAQCHSAQFNSMFQMNWDSIAKKEKATPVGRTPRFDTLMRPHGFTREHASHRGHAFMLVDHLLVDRAYGGRFQLKSWELIGDGAAAQRSAWEVLFDVEPQTNNQKAFLEQTVTAANPVCMFCKSTDNLLEWAYMGDPHPRAKWDRTSNVVDFARSLNHPMACVTCHDPHSTQPRVVRDALIEAVVDRGEGTYPYDPEKSKETTMEKVMFRGGFRAIGLLNQPDSNLMCAQCHVEYNCNPGIDAATGKRVGMDDRRTNLFQWVNVWDYNTRMYNDFKFIDFRHAITGADLMKIQHPEVEVFWGSKMEQAGVECKDCHMPKTVTDAGVEYTSHFMTTPLVNVKGTCLQCHTDWSEERAVYTIKSTMAYTRGKITKAEFWLAELIGTFVRAMDLGVSEKVLAEARPFHTEASTHWEWWIAENSDGFHNPGQARASLTHSMTQSQKGIAILNKAIEERRAIIRRMS